MQGEATIDRPWLASWPAGVPKSIDYPDIAVDELLRRAAKKYANRPAISFYGKSISYGELDAAADRFAAGLRKIGVRRGDRVSLVLPNTPHFIVAFFGVLRAGGIVVQTNPLYTARELEQLWTDAGVQTVIALDLFWHNVSKATTNAGVRRVVVCDVGEFLKTPLRQLYLVRTAGGPAPEKPESVDEVAVLQYTGGTTGTSKGAMLTHRNLVANAMQTAAWFPQATHGPEKVLGAIPMFHVYGLTAVMLFSIVTGNEVVLYPNPREIGAILKLINKTKPSLFPGVPTMYIAILRHPRLAKYDLRSIRACLSGAAPLPNEVRKQFESATGGRLVEGYGLTEASPVTHCNPLNGVVKECIGIPFPDTDAKVVDPDDPSRELSQGEVGELAVRGPQVMKGYWNKPEETRKVLRDGWLLTGDLAKMDPDGYFYIVDRKKDMIICSGYNVYPREVEEVLFMHPAIGEAAAIGVPDPYRGESVKAFVVLKPGKTATEADIIAFCKERLAPFKVPKAVEFATALPMSLVGKVLRRQLREQELAKASTTR
ncbi:MAG: long-chain fatty acid--CoA ligase [Methanobacteriota archaeon]|nr:MAG: long-chain fatty acid--CoA ligase [Euryarchaeota archaeon]